MRALTNLRAILEYYEIQNRELAQAINVSPSMVSNWVQGKRALRTSSGSIIAIADYILLKRLPTSRDITWLKKHFEQESISTDFNSVSDIKRSLIIWLSDDGQDVLEIFKNTRNIQIENEQDNLSVSQCLNSIGPVGRIYNNDYSARAGIVDISLRLGRVFETISEGVTIDICLSSEMATTILEDIFVAEIIKAFQSKKLRIRMLVALTSKSVALSRIINAYSQIIVSGNMEIYTSHGMMQPMIYQTSIFIPDICAVSITELPDSNAPPAAVFITEHEFLKDAASGFDRIVRFAQPLMSVYPKSLTKGIINLFNRQFSDEGDLDIQSDAINPLMMEQDEFKNILEQNGFKGNAQEWRCEEFMRMQTGFENNLKKGSVCREIISAEYIKEMVLYGTCELPSLYFMDTGKIRINRKMCLSVLNGYVRMLETYPNYQLVARQSEENLRSARYIKCNRHIIFIPWKNTRPALIYSEQMIIIHEFQTSFNELWMRLSMGTRDKTISLLNAMIKEMENT